MSLSVGQSNVENFKHQTFTIPKTNITLNKVATIFAVFSAFVGAALVGFLGLLAGVVGYTMSAAALNSCKKDPSQAVQPMEEGNVTPQVSSLSALQPTSNRVLSFLEGAPDDKGRTYDQILSWKDRQLEDEHDWVQQIFPTRELSKHHPNPEKWVVNHEIAAAIRSNPAHQKKLKRALSRILSFYKLNRPTSLESLSSWLTPHNHNFHRLTRIIKSLKLAGLESDANYLMNRLNSVHEVVHGAPLLIGDSINFWRAAASDTSERLYQDGRGWNLGRRAIRLMQTPP